MLVTQLVIAGGAPWSRVVFTTYALSLTFFETVVMDSLVRGGAKQVLILSDVEGVKASLSEKGVRSAGRDYLVEPVAVVQVGPQWYLTAWCRLRDGVRAFRIDRITEAFLTRQPVPERDIPPIEIPGLEGSPVLE